MSQAWLQLLIALVVVFGVNLVPAFAPPTWAVLVYFRFTDGLAIAPLVVGGALAAAAGRLVLAVVFRHLGTRLPPRRRESLEALGTSLSASRMGLVASLAFFVVSPVPSNALFEAVGLARVRLAPLAAAFLVGRLCSYTFYLVAASTAQGTVRDIVTDGVASPRALVLGLVGVAGVLAVLVVDWERVISRVQAWAEHRRAHGKTGPSGGG